jgi:predicted HTH domain antitoxin
MYENIAARIPERTARDIDYVAKEENTDKSKVIRELLFDAVKSKLLELALQKYSKREVSLGRAAELAKMRLSDFMVKASERKIPINYSVESLEKDFKAAMKAK